jgi:16S rRNA (adenine1518-N6/adenine1519-N6)-dimethyltransferase
VEQRLLVQRGAFRPVPGVDSAVVTMRFCARDRVAVHDRAGFERLVRAAFGQRRKMLRNTVLAAAPGLTRSDLEAVSTRADLDLTRRPETLEIAEFARLSDALTELGAGLR